MIPMGIFPLHVIVFTFPSYLFFSLLSDDKTRLFTIHGWGWGNGVWFRKFNVFRGANAMVTKI